MFCRHCIEKHQMSLYMKRLAWDLALAAMLAFS